MPTTVAKRVGAIVCALTMLGGTTPQDAQQPAQEATEPPALAPSISVRVHGGVSQEALSYIAEIGQPTVVTVAADENVLPRLQTKCGNTRNVYRTLIKNTNKALDLSDDFVARVGGELSLPACPILEQNVTLVAEQKLTVSRMLRRETGWEGDNVTEDFLALNPAIRQSKNKLIIPQGQTYVLPYRTAPTTIILNPDKGLTAEQAAANVASRLGGEMIVTPSTTGVITGAMALNQPGDKACTKPVKDQPWPIDVAPLLQALEDSQVRADKAKRSKPSVVVAVLDTGIAQPPAALLGWARFLTLSDPNAANYFGLDGVTRKKGPVGTPGIKDADHGTQVAVLTAGGLDFLAADKKELSKIKLRPEKILRTDNGEILEQYVDYGLRDATENGATIAVASFQFGASLDMLRAPLEGNKRLLMVTAAGNRSQDIESYPRWPANFGGVEGDLKPQIIAVGSHDADGAISWFSAYGSSYVDVLAPGCAVPSLDLNWQRKTEDGTSFAAPLVAFTAGLLTQLGLIEPSQIRERIIVSADVRGDLFNKAWSSGSLNPTKAVSFYTDLVQVKGSPELKRGKIFWDFDSEFVCKDGQNFSRNADILKLAPLAGSSDWILVWRPIAGNLKRCRVELPQGSLTLQVGPNNDEIPATDLLDAIVATKFTS